MSCNNCRKLRTEIKMLNKVIELAEVGEWNMSSVYINVMEGTWQDHDSWNEPDPALAKWLVEKFKLTFEGEEPERCPVCASAIMNPGKTSHQDHEFTLECMNQNCGWTKTYIRRFHHYDKRKRKGK